MHYVLNNTYLFEVLNSFAIMINYLYLQCFVFVISIIKAGKFFSEQGQADERVNEALVYRSVVMSALYAF